MIRSLSDIFLIGSLATLVIGSVQQSRVERLLVGMSYGKDKIEAIKGAIAGGLVNVLVTDVPTAELLLK